MRCLVAFLLSFFTFLTTACSQEHKNLVKAAEEKLKTGKATISQILTDKKYDTLHPETSFRNLIEKYAKAETIAIVTDTIPGKKIIQCINGKCDDSQNISFRVKLISKCQPAQDCPI